MSINNQEIVNPISIFSDESIDIRCINGFLMFCYWNPKIEIAHYRFKFPDELADKLYSIGYYKYLISTLSVEIERKQRDKAYKQGGGVLCVTNGKLSINWATYKKAAKMMDDDCYDSKIH